jgi:hypothetical protein
MLLRSLQSLNVAVAAMLVSLTAWASDLTSFGNSTVDAATGETPPLLVISSLTAFTGFLVAIGVRNSRLPLAFAVVGLLAALSCLTACWQNHFPHHEANRLLSEYLGSFSVAESRPRQTPLALAVLAACAFIGSFTVHSTDSSSRHTSTGVTDLRAPDIGRRKMRITGGVVEA